MILVDDGLIIIGQIPIKTMNLVLNIIQESWD